MSRVIFISIFLVSYLRYKIKPSIFGLWTNQDIWGRYLGNWKRLINISDYYLETKQQIDESRKEKLQINLQWKTFLAAALL